MTSLSARQRIEPLSIAVEEGALLDLRARIERTRWPDAAPDEPWRQGADLEYLKSLLHDWARFDWRAAERRLNTFANFRIFLDGVWIHLVHEPARNGRGVPLILTHGWPSLYIEYLPLVPLLTDPAVHGIDGPAFDVVIPSLPGYGFSERPPRTGVNYREVGRLWHDLMTRIGYQRYGAAGGDFGAGVSTLIALDRPEAVIGLHLSTVELSPHLGPETRPVSAAERAYLEQAEEWWAAEGGYKAVQSTKPQTLGYGLTDSPAGLAAWICEKWRSWTDSGGNLDARVPRDFLLTLLTLYWASGSISSSIRDYFDNRWHRIALGPADVVDIPTGFALFNHQFVPEGEPPREWAERLYQVRRWTSMPRGGHFAPVEEPRLLATDIAAFFGSLEWAPGRRRIGSSETSEE